jgi:ADP-heptose:LPS heptosyltransferase
MFYLGVPRVEIPRASLFVEGDRLQQGTYAVMHPFASAMEKSWPSHRFVELARKMATPVAVLAGPQDDATPFADFLVYRNASLNTVKLLLRDASVFVGNDSGPAHMAAAFGVPSVVLFGPSNVDTWAPWKTESRVLQGLLSITVEACLNAVESLQVRA